MLYVKTEQHNFNSPLKLVFFLVKNNMTNSLYSVLYIKNK